MGQDHQDSDPRTTRKKHSSRSAFRRRARCKLPLILPEPCPGFKRDYPVIPAIPGCFRFRKRCSETVQAQRRQVRRRDVEELRRIEAEIDTATESAKPALGETRSSCCGKAFYGWRSINLGQWPSAPPRTGKWPGTFRVHRRKAKAQRSLTTPLRPTLPGLPLEATSNAASPTPESDVSALVPATPVLAPTPPTPPSAPV